MEVSDRFKPLPLYPRGRAPQYPLDRRLVGPRADLDALEKRKILHCRESNPAYIFERVEKNKLSA
jgi:hypothetical protein